MKNSMYLMAAAFLCLVAFPTITVGKNLRFLPKPIKGWPHPSDIYRNTMLVSTSHKFNYGDSKPPTHSPPPPTPKISPPPPTPSPPTPIISPPPPTPLPSPPTPKTSPLPPTPSPPLPTPKISPQPPTPSLAPPTPNKSPSPPPPTPSLPPPAPKKSPSPSPPSYDEPSSPSQPSNPPPEHHHSHHHHHHHHHHHQSPSEHIGSCLRNMGPVGVCRGQMALSFFTRMFQVSDYCCNLVVNMKSECEDVIWGYFTDPFFVPLVRFTCHVSY
ncbi:hypothetical protein N665_1442s0009 [Sinapis alba]|nr:hypothetical protein N665_1442s0009 [Sinapis alba]